MTEIICIQETLSRLNRLVFCLYISLWIYAISAIQKCNQGCEVKEVNGKSWSEEKEVRNVVITLYTVKFQNVKKYMLSKNIRKIKY